MLELLELALQPQYVIKYQLCFYTSKLTISSKLASHLPLAMGCYISKIILTSLAVGSKKIVKVAKYFIAICYRKRIS